MSDNFESSLINLGELSKPATVLVEKISDAVGGIFKPYQIVRVAKAEAQADRVRAEGQIEVSDIQLGFKFLKLPKKLHVMYYGAPVLLELPKDADNSLDVGKVLLTKIGQELAPICGSAPAEGFFDYVSQKWKSLEYITDPTAKSGNKTNSPPLSADATADEPPKR